MGWWGRKGIWHRYSYRSTFLKYFEFKAFITFCTCAPLARPLSPSPGHADAGRTPEPSKAEAAPAPIPAHEPAPAADSEFDEEPVAQPAAKPAPASPPPAQEASQQKPPVRDFDEEAYVCYKFKCIMPNNFYLVLWLLFQNLIQFSVFSQFLKNIK